VASTTARVHAGKLMKNVTVHVTLVEPPAFRFRLWAGSALIRLGAALLGCRLVMDGPETWASQTRRSFQTVLGDGAAGGQLVEAVADKAAWLAVGSGYTTIYTQAELQQMLADEVLRRIVYGVSAEAVLARLDAVDGIRALYVLMEEKLASAE